MQRLGVMAWQVGLLDHISSILCCSSQPQLPATADPLGGSHDGSSGWHPATHLGDLMELQALAFGRAHAMATASIRE